MDSGETVALLRAHFDTRRFGYWNKSLCKVQFNVRSESHSSRFWFRPPWRALRWRNPAVPAAASATTKNHCPVRARRRAQLNHPGRHVTPNLNPMSRAAHRAESGGESGSGSGGNFDGSWVAVAVGTPCGSSSERITISSGRISGELSTGSVSPNGSTRTGGSVQGLSWNSSGRFSGRTGSGSYVRSDGCTGRWTASRQ